MILKLSKNGVFFKLDKQDFKADWQGFLKEIKKLKSTVFNPVEMDDDNWWYVGNVDKDAMIELYKTHIKKPLADLANYKDIGYKPIPKAGGWKTR